MSETKTVATACDSSVVWQSPDPEKEMAAIAAIVSALSPLADDPMAMMRVLTYVEGVGKQYGRAAVEKAAASMSSSVDAIAEKLQALKAELKGTVTP